MEMVLQGTKLQEHSLKDKKGDSTCMHYIGYGFSLKKQMNFFQYTGKLKNTPFEYENEVISVVYS